MRQELEERRVSLKISFLFLWRVTFLLFLSIIIKRNAAQQHRCLWTVSLAKQTCNLLFDWPNSGKGRVFNK